MAYKGDRMGKYYVRKDGTTIANDNTDRRKRLITQAPESKKDVGDTRHQSEASVKEYIITFKDGTRLTTTGESPKQLRAQYGNTKPIESIKRVRRKDKSR